MEINKVSPDEGWRWYASGWRHFVRNPGIQIAYFVILVLISIAVGLVPVIGGIVVALLVPVIMGGWFHALSRLESGDEISLGTLFEGFRNKAWTGPLIVLGALMLVAEVLIGLAAVAILGSSMLDLTELTDPAQLSALFGAGTIGGIVIVLILATLLFMAFFYAVPLIIFADVAPVAALQSSLSASLRNVWAVSVFGLVYLVAGFVAAIPFGLGFLVLIPVTIATIFASYQSVFGAQTASGQVTEP
jgi:uncharacterized membrane protein